MSSTHKGYFELGRIVKPHSFKGAVKVKFTHEKAHEIEFPESVYIAINDKLVPFFIDSLLPQLKGFAIVKFEGIDTEEQSRFLAKKWIFLPNEFEPVPQGKEFYRSELIGFTVFDKEKGEIGLLQDLIEGAAQRIFSIDSKGKEILIPAIDNFIVKIDRKAKELYLDAPEGLIDFYLGE